MENFDALFHRLLECLASADEAHAAGAFIDNGGLDSVGKVIFARLSTELIRPTLPMKLFTTW